VGEKLKKLDGTVISVRSKKGYHPTANDNFNNSCRIPVIFVHI